MLESPVPFFTGVKVAEADFQSKILPTMKGNQGNKVLLIYLDSNSLIPYEFKPEDFDLPHFNGAFQKFMSDYGKYHGLKKSRFIEVEKKKVGKKEVHKLKMRAKAEKKVSVNKSKPKVVPLDILYSMFRY